MRFVSTRGASTVSLDEALVKGIADDGGLFIPADLPSFSVTDFDSASTVRRPSPRSLQYYCGHFFRIRH